MGIVARRRIDGESTLLITRCVGDAVLNGSALRHIGSVYDPGFWWRVRKRSYGTACEVLRIPRIELNLASINLESVSEPRVFWDARGPEPKLRILEATRDYLWFFGRDITIDNHLARAFIA